MQLTEFLANAHTTQRMMAEALGLHIHTVNRWCTGRSLPGRSDMRAIYKWTGGAVAPNDFYDLPDLAADGASPPPAEPGPLVGLMEAAA